MRGIGFNSCHVNLKYEMKNLNDVIQAMAVNVLCEILTDMDQKKAASEKSAGSLNVGRHLIDAVCRALGCKEKH